MQAVGIQSTFVKFGAPNRGERVALYNRLGRIADQLDSQGAMVPRSEFPFCAIHQPEPELTDDNTSQIQDDQSIESFKCAVLGSNIALTPKWSDAADHCLCLSSSKLTD